MGRNYSKSILIGMSGHWVQDRVGSNTAKTGAGNMSLHLGYYGEHFAIKHSKWESRVCGWDITNSVLCIPLPTIYTTESYLDLNICSCTIVKQCLKNLDPAPTAKRFTATSSECQKTRDQSSLAIPPSIWLYSTFSEQRCWKTETSWSSRPLSQAGTWHLSRGSSITKKLFSGSSCHEEAGDFKYSLGVDKLLAPNGFNHVTLCLHGTEHGELLRVLALVNVQMES